MDKVSVIIPSYNHKSFVAQTISSVLVQSHKNIEIIVIDDGSQDGSVELLIDLASRYNFQLILKENEGVCATLNRGISLATGSFLTFLASDDLMPPSRIVEQLEAFKNYPDVDVVAGGIRIIDESSKIIGMKRVRTRGYVNLDQMLKRNIIFAPTAMFKKTVFETYGLYKKDFIFEDYYMWLRILSRGGKIYNTNNVWADYRISRGNLEKRFKWYFDGYIQTLSEYLPDPKVRKAIDRYLLIYCAKMILLKGFDFYKANYLLIKKLHVAFQVGLFCFSLVPNKLRQNILMSLLKRL